MNRRGLFGALAGGLAAAVGIKPGVSGRTVTFLKGSATGKTEMLFQQIGAPERSGLATFGAPARHRIPVLTSHGTVEDVASLPPDPDTVDLVRTDEPRPAAAPVPAFSPPTAPDDLPTVWPGHSGTITATADLSPLAQVEVLIELFGRSGDAAPSFAAALIGELVLTRMRLASADPRTLVSLRADLP